MTDRELFGSYLHPRLGMTGSSASLRARFESADPFPWLVIDDFLAPEFADALHRGFPQKDPGYEKYCIGDDGKIGTNYANSVVADFPSVFQELDRILRNQVFLDFLGDITGIGGLKSDPDYFGGGIRESQGGAFLPVHIDFNYHPRTLQHRRLNLLLYLNEDWEEAWGGAIQVHRDPRRFPTDSLVASIAPVLNRCFIFETSERSWHGFNRLAPPSGRSRRAFTIYYYTDDRPGAAEVKFHNTEYVEPPLPDWLVPGYTLTVEDIALLREALARRDNRIELLYRMRAEADDKFAHAWKEYEYYLGRTQKLEAELEPLRRALSSDLKFSS